VGLPVGGDQAGGPVRVAPHGQSQYSSNPCEAFPLAPTSAKRVGVCLQVWDFLWSAIKQADLFVSHPMVNFVPDTVPLENVVMMPASTDLLDGLNKDLNDHDTSYYHKVRTRPEGRGPWETS
jgi:hypothetical protein